MPTLGRLIDYNCRGSRCVGVGVMTLLGCGCAGLKEGGTLPPFDVEAGVADVRSTSDGAADAGAEGASEAASGDASTDESTGTESGDGPIEASLDTDQPALNVVVPLNLRLWLTADKGITCSSGRVTKWADQSGAGRDATLQLGQLGPECQLMPAPHLINGMDIPYFSAPANGNVVDETLDVDLTFLANSAYTLFVVERRWFDAPDASWSENLLGTNIPVEANLNLDCASRPPDSVLQFGYVYYQGTPQLSFDQECDGIQANIAAAPARPPAPVGQDTAIFDPVVGHAVWRDGVQLLNNAFVSSLLTAANGAVGRGVVMTTATGLDGRFRGDIAEVLVYDAALSDVERRAVEGYLKGHWKY
jgi:hypothetical protein